MRGLLHSIHGLKPGQVLIPGLIALGLTGSVFFGPLHMPNAPIDRFKKLLVFEIQNRAFARCALKRIAEKEVDPARRAFWEAYLALEVVNMQTYQPIADKFAMDQHPVFMTRRKIEMFVVINKWLPEYTIKTMQKRIREYINQLREMKRLAKQEDQLFCDYVIAQEVVQAEAVELMLANNQHDATRLLQDFVNQRNSPAY